MPIEPREDEIWSPCPEGALRQIAARQRAAAGVVARRRSMLGAAASVLVAVGVVVTAGLASGNSPVQIKCKGCHQRFSEFRDHMSGDHRMADPRVVEGMKRHLKKCRGCQKKFKDKFPGCPLGANNRCRSKCDRNREYSVRRDYRPELESPRGA